MQLVYHAYMNATGYSVAAQDYILAIKQTKPDLSVKLHYMNLATKTGISPNRQQLFNAMTKTPEEHPQVAVYHSIPQRYRRPRGPKKFVGLCMFETMNPPAGWIKMMNEMDAIITGSQFNARIFRQHGLTKPLHVVPHAFDKNLFNREVVANGRYRQFTFMSIGTWKKRKNWESLIKAFYDGFERRDNVCLLIKTDKPRELENAVQRIKRTCEWRSKETAPIYAEQKTNCQFEEIPSIMQKCDVYVSASLGEGFGLPGLHAMALGIPVVITKYAGVTEYAKPETCTFIEPRGYRTHPNMDGIPQFNNCIWPELRIGDIRDSMRKVFEEYPKEKAMTAYKYVHENFNYDVIGRKFLEALEIC
jgi:glycosyltransferase involved in cell wall biosynthesis